MFEVAPAVRDSSRESDSVIDCPLALANVLGMSGGQDRSG
jgi:hypothetical protein